MGTCKRIEKIKIWSVNINFENKNSLTASNENLSQPQI